MSGNVKRADSQSPSGGFGTVIRLLTRVHDRITDLSFAIAMVGVGYLTLVLAFEVLARYGLQRPTAWAPDTAAFSFAAITFLAAPKLAWKSGHAKMNLVINALPPKQSLWLRRATLLLAVVVCGLVAWFGFFELLRLYKRGVTMIAVTPIPKWWLKAAIVYCLSSMGLYYLRHFLCSWFNQSDSVDTNSRSA